MAASCVLAAGSVTPTAHGQAGGGDTLPDQVNACALLSAAEVAETTGLPADPGTRRDAGYESNGAYSSTCIWMLGRDPAVDDAGAAMGGRSFVILNVMRWPAGSRLAGSFLQAFHDAAASGEIPGEPAPRDYGDAALWWGDGLAVRKGDVSFGISVVIRGRTPARPGEFEEQLAPRILQRLEDPAD